MRLCSFGLIALTLACSSSEEETAQELSAAEIGAASAQDRAQEILLALEDNIRQDVPAVVQKQEKFVGALEKDVILPFRSSHAWTGFSASIKSLLAENAKVAGMQVLDDTEKVREIAGILERRGVPTLTVVLIHT